jgi:hypothetical protein
MNTGKIYGKFNKILNLFLFSSFLILATVGFASAQIKATSRVDFKFDKKPEKLKTTVKTKTSNYDCDQTETNYDVSEKSIAVSEKVNISICIKEGQVKVNGWNRNEIRAFVNKGSGVGFSVLEKGKDKKAVWVKVLGYDPSKEDEDSRQECVSGSVIELDVPFGATVNIKSGESKTTIDSVAKVFVKNVGGDIFLNNIPNGIEARTYRGNVTVKNSGGSMTLETTNGNIVAYDASSDEIGDFFRAKTNSGAITLQKIKYRETEVNSNSGSINFVGEILNGGQYYFGSANSLITLVLPENSSSKIIAVYGYGNFDSEIPMKELKRDENSKLRSLSATFGKGEALLNFKTVTGKIFIKKQ